VVSGQELLAIPKPMGWLHARFAWLRFALSRVSCLPGQQPQAL
jgi:hypothetical protein